MYERMWKVSIFYSALTCKSRHMGGARHSKNQCNDKILSVHVFYGLYGILLTSQISLYAILVLLSAMCIVSLSSLTLPRPYTQSINQSSMYIYYLYEKKMSLKKDACMKPKPC